MVVVLTRRVVTFDGAGGGEGELSWGQIEIWLKMAALGQALAQGGTRPLPEDTTLDDVEDELRYLMGRYQTMRTRLVFGVGGWPRQVVHDQGEIELEVVDVDAADPAECAAEMEARYRSVPFDYTRAWPVRMGVVRRDGRCLYLTLIVSHLVLDGASAVIMMTETEARSTTPVGGATPLEQARQQALPTARRQQTAALRHWDTLLRTMPDPAIPPSRDVRSPRHWTGRLRTTRLPQALAILARRGGTEVATALLATFALAFAQVVGTVAVPIRLVVSNRFRPGLADTVSPISQPGLCLIDTSGGQFTEVLRRARGAALAAYKHAYYDKRDLDRTIAAVVADRGAQFDLDVSFNDRCLGGALLDVAPSHTSDFTWVGSADDPSSAFFVQVDGSDDVMEIHLHIDSYFMAPDDGAEILWAMEEIAATVAAATVTSFSSTAQ